VSEGRAIDGRRLSGEPPGVGDHGTGRGGGGRGAGGRRDGGSGGSGRGPGGGAGRSGGSGGGSGEPGGPDVQGYLDDTVGAMLVRRASRRPELWGFIITAGLGLFIYLLFCEPKPQALDYFSRLAEAFLHGQYSIDRGDATWLNELIPMADGRWLVPYPPMPAVLAMPFVAVFGREFPAQVYSSIYAGLAVGVVYLVLGALNVGLRVRDRLALTLVFAFGTCFWYIAISGSAWYFAHVTAVLLFALAVLSALRRWPAWIAGLLLGLAALCRLPTGLALPFVLAAQLGMPGIRTLRDMDRRRLIRTVVLFGLGLAVPAAIYVWFNELRWGTITDQAYVLIPGVLEDPIYEKHGILSPWYIPRNVFAILFRSWNYVDDPPYLQPSWWGLGIFLTTPLLLWMLKARWRTPVVAWAAVSVAIVSIPIITHGNVGITQFGYRFSLDFQVLLFVILATVVARGWTRLMKAAAVLSVAFCWYAIWAISIGFVDF
jgi:hypothetical protein